MRQASPRCSSCITTDASVAPATLDAALRTATSLDVRPTRLRRLHVDQRLRGGDGQRCLRGHWSGAISRRRPSSSLLVEVCRDLALSLLADAEGASKQIEVFVTGAASETDAVEVARSVARSNLFKCAIHGEDPNWGRVLAAVGTTSARLRGRRSVGGNEWRCGGRCAVRPSPTRADVDLSGEWVKVAIDLGAGDATGWVWTSDLTAAYVHENSAYSS